MMRSQFPPTPFPGRGCCHDVPPRHRCFLMPEVVCEMPLRLCSTPVCLQADIPCRFQPPYCLERVSVCGTPQLNHTAHGTELMLPLLLGIRDGCGETFTVQTGVQIPPDFCAHRIPDHQQCYVQAHAALQYPVRSETGCFNAFLQVSGKVYFAKHTVVCNNAPMPCPPDKPLYPHMPPRLP